MKLYAKVLPEYFDMLDFKSSEFRQFEDITLENSETHELRTFTVDGIRMLHDFEAVEIKKRYPKVSWNPILPIFVISLGDRIDSVHVPEVVTDHREDRRAFELPVIPKKRWCAVGD